MEWSEFINNFKFEDYRGKYISAENAPINMRYKTDESVFFPREILTKRKDYESNLNKYHKELENLMFRNILFWWYGLTKNPAVYGHTSEMYLELEKHCKDVLEKKGEEYSILNDRLYHFKECDKYFGGGVQKQIIDERKKHLMSILDLFKNPTEYKTTEYYNEKFGDYINYTILLFYAVECGID